MPKALGHAAGIDLQPTEQFYSLDAPKRLVVATCTEHVAKLQTRKVSMSTYACMQASAAHAASAGAGSLSLVTCRDATQHGW